VIVIASSASTHHQFSHEKKVDEATQKKNEWIDLFDLVIAASGKPAFMLDPYLQLFRVNMQDGSLKNTDGVFEIEALGPNGAKKFLEQGKVFQGGNWQHLHAMLQINAGDEIMYVGDHLYADVLRSKRTLGWRSMFIMPELEEEIKVFSENIPLYRKISALRNLREELGMRAEAIRRNADPNDPETIELLGEMEDDDVTIKSALTTMAEYWHSRFHPVWGAMFNAGYQDSRFAFYVENYACLYTARATNLGLESRNRSFRTTMEKLPHDFILADPDSEYNDVNPWD
jgi:5'-nucleotidase